MKLLVINGPKLNMLGIREPEIYGRETYADLCALIQKHCDEKSIEVTFYQSNHEGAIVDEIQAACGRLDGIVINPGGYTHTSVAIRDAIAAVGLPTVEVHISDVSAREDFRQRSFVRATCIATVMGKGFDGYCEAMDILLKGAQAE